MMLRWKVTLLPLRELVLSSVDQLMLQWSMMQWLELPMPMPSMACSE